MVIAGGNDGANALATTYIFDPETNTVSAGPAMSAARSGLSATTLLDGTVLLAGGFNGTDELGSAERLDAVGSAVSAPDNGLLVPRQNHLALLLPHNNQVLIVGGIADGQAVAAAEYFTPWDGVNGVFCAEAVCASGYPGPAVPATARAWAAGAALSVPADTEVRTGPADGLALVAGGNGSKSADLFGFATVRTDKEDYAPGTTVTITGGGWQSGEWVALVLQEVPALDEHPLELVQADANGNIVSTEFVPDEHDIGVRFYLTAYGVASQAQTTFRDGVPTSLALASSPDPSEFGQSVTFTATITCTGPCTFGSSHVVEFRDGGNNCGQGAVLVSNVAVAVINSTSASATYSTSALSVGNHTIRACLSGPNAAGQPNSANGTTAHSVTKANPTLSVANSPQTYDGAPKAAAVTSPVAGSVSDIRYNGSTTAPTTAGSYTVTADFTPTNTASYNTLSDAPAGTFIISQAPSATTVAVTNATYDGSPHGGTASVTGAGGLSQSLSISYSGDSGTVYDPTSTPPTDAGDYLATATFAGDVNHTGSSDTTSFAISQASVAVTVTAADATYDGLAHGATAVVTGAGGLSQSVPVQYTGLVYGTTAYSSSAAPTEAGSYTATANFAGDANHTNGSDSKNFVINKASTTLTLSVANASYDGAPHGATATVTGANGLNEAVAIEYEGLVYGTISYLNSAPPTEAGSYTASASYAGTGNYEPSSDSKPFTISKATTTVTVEASDSIYDGNQHGATATVTGPGGLSQAVTIEYSGSVYESIPYLNSAAPTDTGSYTATAIYAGSGNYDGDTGSKAFAITKAGSTTVVTATDAPYDGNPHGGTATVTGVGGLSESVAVTYTGRNTTAYPSSPTAPTNAGDYTATATYAGGPNHMTSTDSQDFTISKADATVVVNGYTGTYDGTSHSATGTATGVGGVDLNAGLNLGASFTNVPGGAANWSFTGGTNYNDQNGSVDIIINKADATVSVNGYTGIYDGVAHGATGTATGVGGVDLNAGLNLGASFTDVPGGTANWSFTNPNYEPESGTASLVITKATSTTVVTVTDAVYDGNPHGGTANATGVGGLNELVAVTYSGRGTTAYGPSPTAPTNAGLYTASATFAGATNHFGSNDSTDFTINKANATIDVVGYTGVYDATAHGASGTATGVGGVNLTAGLTLGASFTDAPGGTAHWTFVGDSNHNDASGDVAIVINKANATIVVTGYNVVWDGLEHMATGTATGVSGEPLAGLNLDATKHTLVGAWNDTWTFVSPNANYNGASGTVNDAIGAWTENGYFAPVDMTAGSTIVWNTVKGGSTVPLKFEIFAGGIEKTTTAAVAGFAVNQVSCAAGFEDAIDTLTTTGGTSLRYDSTSGFFIQNWQTPKAPGRCYQVVMTAQDGSQINRGFFKLK